MYQPEDAMEIPAELAFIFSKMDGVFLRKMFILLLLSVISDIYDCCFRHHLESGKLP